MSAIATEVIKKINEKNMTWFALTIILVVSSVMVFPDFFKMLAALLEGVGIAAPYSKIIIGLLYVSVGVMLIKPIIMFISYRKRTSKFRNLIKKLDTLTDDEGSVLMTFVVDQVTVLNINAKWTHVARMLKTKGFLSTGWQLSSYDGSEDFFMSEKLLDYLTTRFQVEVAKARELKYSRTDY